MTVIGLGTQDDLAQAKDFVAKRGTTFTMLWDSGFSSWRALRIPGQPAAILFGPEGKEIKRWQGRFDENEVVRLAKLG